MIRLRVPDCPRVRIEVLARANPRRTQLTKMKASLLEALIRMVDRARTNPVGLLDRLQSLTSAAVAGRKLHKRKKKKEKGYLFRHRRNQGEGQNKGKGNTKAKKKGKVKRMFGFRLGKGVRKSSWTRVAGPFSATT